MNKQAGVLKEDFGEKYREERVMELKDLIRPELILSNVSAETDEEALKQIVERLLQEGYVEQGYFEMLLARERKFPTGLETAPFAVALPHTEPDYVVRPCIAIAKLKEPVSFLEMAGSGREVQVHYIFNLVLQKSEQQLELLQLLMGVFSNENIMKSLEKEERPEEIAKILSNIKES